MDRRVIKTKRAIEEAYLSLVSEKDSKKITVTELADRAAIDRKTFYLHYSTVDDIMEEIVQVKIEELKGLFKKYGCYDQPDQIIPFFNALSELIFGNLEFLKKMARNKAFDSFWESVEEHLYILLMEVGKNLKDEYQKHVWVYARLFASGILAVYKQWLTEDHAEEVTEMEALSSLGANGFASFLLTK